MFIYLNMIQSEEDRSKFEEIYTTYRQIMLYVSNRIVRDQYLAEDIVHQAFLKIVDNLDKINEINCHKTKGYIVVIVQNLSIDFYRKRKRENNISFNELELYVEDIKNNEDSMMNDVEEAISKLPINYLTVLRLKFSHGNSYNEISEILGISETNVRQRISRGKKMLQEILDREESLSYE